MDWYNAFNAVEAGWWGVVAGVIARCVPCSGRQQRAAVGLASVAFVAFGVSDLLEIGRAGAIPLWLWGLKIACGAAILAARYTWRGWTTFRWRDRKFLFGLGCLAAVGLVIAVQHSLGPTTSASQNSRLSEGSAIRRPSDRVSHFPNRRRDGVVDEVLIEVVITLPAARA